MLHLHLLLCTLPHLLASAPPTFPPLLTDLQLQGEGEAACGGLEVRRCWVARVVPGVLERGGVTLPGGRVLQVVGREGASVTYRGEGGQAVLTQRGEVLYGRLELGEAEYRLECVGKGRVLWQELEPAVWGEGEPLEEERGEQLEHLQADRLGKLEAQGRQDSATVVWYSVTVYYTREVAENTMDLDTYVDQVLG